jgi:hypothetical protein
MLAAIRLVGIVLAETVIAIGRAPQRIARARRIA